MKINVQCVCQKALTGKERGKKIKADKPELVQGSSLCCKYLPAQLANKKLHCITCNNHELEGSFCGYLLIKFINVLEVALGFIKMVGLPSFAQS